MISRKNFNELLGFNKVDIKPSKQDDFMDFEHVDEDEFR